MSLEYKGFDSKYKEFIEVLDKTLTLDEYNTKPDSFAQNFMSVKINNIPTFTFNINFSNCIRLDLTDNQLTDLPQGIEYLTNLKHLILNKNFFSDFSPRILKLVNLEELSLRENRFNDFPVILNGLPNLGRVTMGKFLNGTYTCHELFTEEWRDIATSKLTNCPDSDLPMLYTLYGNSFLNPLLRSGIIPKFMLPIYNTMICGQTSVMDGRPSVLFRGVPGNLYSEVQVGDIILDQGFSSYTINPKIAASFTDETPTVIMLSHHDKCLYLDYEKGTSLVSEEDELVLGPGLEIEVSDVFDRILWQTSGNIFKPFKVISTKTVGYSPNTEISTQFEEMILSEISNNEEFLRIFKRFVSGDYSNFYESKELLLYLIKRANGTQ